MRWSLWPRSKPQSAASSKARVSDICIAAGGQFGWDAPSKRKIEVGDVDVDKDKYQSLYENRNTIGGDSTEVCAASASQNLYVMTLDPQNGRYKGKGDAIHVSANTMSSSRIGEPEIVLDIVGYTSAVGLRAMVLETRSEGCSVSASGSFAAANAGGSRNTTKTTTENSAIDLNGDLYPDWVSNSGSGLTAQYTSQTGPLSEQTSHYDFSSPESESCSWSVTAGASKKMGGRSVTPQVITPKSLVDSGNDANAKASSSAGVSGSFAASNDASENIWLDINGDGLPDMVYDNGTVRLNQGYSFSAPIYYGHSAVQKSHSSTESGGVSFYLPVTGYFGTSGGASFSATQVQSRFMFADIDGDGLPDMVDEDGVAFNNGQGFDSREKSYGLLPKACSTAMSAHGEVSVKFRVPLFMFGFLFITPNVSAGTAESSSRARRQLLDIDGDGYADLLESEKHDKIKVRRNKAGKTNLLRQVTSPLGATTVIDYDRTGNTYDLPQSRWVMSKVTTDGGDRRNGATSFATAFEYADGYYDRRERDFFGFGVVKSTQLDTEKSDAPYRATTLTYDNRAYETRNLVKEATVTTAGGALISRAETAYVKRSVHDGKSLFVAPSITSTTTFEQGCDGGLTISESYAYDGRGNVTSYTSSTPTDSYTTEIKYHSLNGLNIFTRPSDVKVSVDGKVMRHTTSEVNANGDIVRISQIADGVTAMFDMERDDYGNVTRLIRPSNANGQRFYREYAYDDTHHTLVTNVKDAFGYASSTEYDSKWGLPTRLVDINGNETLFAYDRRGRLTSVTAPYEAEAGGPPTISVEYDDDMRATITTNYDSKTRNAIKTRVFADGLGRIVQTKKSGVVDGHEVMIASGVIKYDALGRKVAEGQPMTDNTPSLNTSEPLNPTLTEYDLHDRPVKVTLPDGTVSTAVRTVFEGLLKTVQTDGNGHTAETYVDARGRVRKTVRHAGGLEIVTEFNYNAIGELVSVVHPNKEVTTYEYDGLGRKTAVNHPDAGLTTYEHDAAGNMTARQTANIRSVDQKGKIRYTYDYERLHEIVYPKNIYSRVTCTYGDSSETRYNRAGRLKLVEDGSGGEAYYYGRMGEVVKTIKSVILSETDVRTYIWEADYDSWNRVRTMTYPDGEAVSYAYDKGGNLKSVTTEKEGDRQTLLAEQRYDKYGNLTYRKMGDGTETRYEYDEKRLYLNSMSLTSGGSAMMECAYKYDAVGNMTGVSNHAAPSGDIGGAFSHAYAYDEINRLVSANGSAKGRTYELLMRYDVMSNPLQKDSALYEYNTTGHPDAVSCVGGRIYTYDPDGNPIAVEDTVANTLRVMQWDEESRLQALGDDGYVSRYTYDHAGGRVVKSHGPATVAFVNGAPQGVLWHDKDNWVMYVSPYMTVTPGRFTKHYYAGSQRIASKIGVGEFSNLYDASKACVTAGQKDYAERINLITQTRNDYYAAIGMPPGPPTAKGIYGEAEYSGGYGAYAIKPLGDYDAPDNWPRKPYKRPHGGTPGPPVMYGKASNPDDEGAGYGYKNAMRQQESDVFYFHSDHLGSTTYVTDKDGDATQFVSYKPYGEALVDEHNTAREQPWRFNGKELDAETGLYYYGARYYDPSLAMWYGVDALAGDYPGLGGYVYCAGNPVGLVDVDGRRAKIANPTSFELLLKGLPPQTRNTITMNDDYTLNVASVKNALEASPSSGNLKALYAIAKDGRLVDFDVTATSYQFVDSETHCTETYDFQSPIYQNEFQELINSFSGTEDEKSQYISTLNSIGIYDETLVNGNFGATLRPRNAQIKYQGGQISMDDNFKVFINPIGTI